MKILCCPAGDNRPHPETLKSLEMAKSLGFDVDVVDVTGSGTGYSEALKKHWSGDLVIVEHDVAFTADQLLSFRDCPHPWCAFGRPQRDWMPYLCITALGFVRFKAAVTSTTDIPDDSPWDALDGHVIESCKRSGFRPHFHSGSVRHFHTGPM